MGQDQLHEFANRVDVAHLNVTREEHACPLLTWIGVDGLARIVRAASLPCVAIGGITPENAGAVYAAGVAGVCAISAILGAGDLRGAVRRFAAARPRA